MESTSPLAEFDSLLASSDVLFVVYYRGHWCPFCIAFLQSLSSLGPRVSSSSGTVIAITSEPAEFLPLTREKAGYQGRIIVDTKNEIAVALKSRGVVEVAVTEKKGYEHGMAQPAVVVLKSGGEVLERWAIVPSVMNFGGAKDRPDLEQVWDNALAKLDQKNPVHLTYKRQGAVSLLLGKVFG